MECHRFCGLWIYPQSSRQKGHEFERDQAWEVVEGIGEGKNENKGNDVINFNLKITEGFRMLSVSYQTSNGTPSM